MHAMDWQQLVISSTLFLVDCTPANTKRYKHAIITTQRRFDGLITCLLCFVFAGTAFYGGLKFIHAKKKEAPGVINSPNH